MTKIEIKCSFGCAIFRGFLKHPEPARKFVEESQVLMTANQLIVNYGDQPAPCDCHSCVLVS